MPAVPLLRASRVGKRFGAAIRACHDISFSVYPGEVLGIVGESGSGKSTLLRCLAGELEPDAGTIELDIPAHGPTDIWRLDEAARRQRLRGMLGLVHQNPRDGLRLEISAGGNIAEPLMVNGGRRYATFRETASAWLDKVEIPAARIDDLPATFSGGMQQRLQIARNLVSQPRLVLMDEPTGGLDVSVQARLLDLLRGLVRELGIAVVVVTHDLAVARMLSDRLLVMRRGEVAETGLADQVLDDPQSAYGQLLVSSVLRV